MPCGENVPSEPVVAGKCSCRWSSTGAFRHTTQARIAKPCRRSLSPRFLLHADGAAGQRHGVIRREARPSRVGKNAREPYWSFVGLNRTSLTPESSARSRPWPRDSHQRGKNYRSFTRYHLKGVACQHTHKRISSPIRRVCPNGYSGWVSTIRTSVYQAQLRPSVSSMAKSRVRMSIRVECTPSNCHDCNEPL